MGHDVKLGSRTPATAMAPQGTKAVALREAVSGAGVVILALPYRAVKDTIAAIGPATFDRKIVVDVCNPVSSTMELAVGGATSAAEELAKLLPTAHVVKAFNTAFAESMTTGKAGGEATTLFVAGDDIDSKKTVIRLGADLGFHAVDAGKLRSARYLEPMALLLMSLAQGQELGRAIGFKMVGKPRAH